MGTALYYSCKSFIASLTLFIHAIMPCWFIHTGSIIIRNMFRSEQGARILIRFNTKFEQDELKRKWRVLIDGEEKLAEKVYVSVPCETVIENVGDDTKYHVMCHGIVKWDHNIAIVH